MKRQQVQFSFGIIVLNGNPFIRYTIEALYPHAHEILIAEGAAESAKAFATEDAHSIDGTYELLQQMKREEDPEDKIRIITNNGQFWKGRNEQSRAYAEVATGNYLWQVDVDEFYRGEDIERVRSLLEEDPELNGATFRWINFWGGKDYVAQGWFQMSGGCDANRLFRWGKGYYYHKHWENPEVVDTEGKTVNDGKWLDARTLEREHGIYCYHYSFVFPSQVLHKSAIYEGGTDPTFENPSAVDWATRVYLRLEDPFHVHNHYDFPSWLERFEEAHPEAILRMFEALEDGRLALECRQTEDIEQLLASWSYALKSRLLRRLFHCSQRIQKTYLRFHFRMLANAYASRGLEGVGSYLSELLQERFEIG